MNYNKSKLICQFFQGNQVLDLLYECLHQENPQIQQIQTVAAIGAVKLIFSKKMLVFFTFTHDFLFVILNLINLKIHF